MPVDRLGREHRVRRGEHDIDEPRGADRRHLKPTGQVCGKCAHLGRPREYLVLFDRLDRGRRRIHRVRTDEPEHTLADCSRPPDDRRADRADRFQGAELRRRRAAELGRLREIEALDGVLGEPGALQDAVLGLVVRLGIHPVGRGGVHPGDHEDTLVFDQHPRRRPVARNRRIALQHHQRHDDGEHGQAEPSVPAEGGESVEQMDIVTARRHRRSACRSGLTYVLDW